MMLLDASLGRVLAKKNVRKRQVGHAFADGLSFISLVVLFLLSCEAWHRGAECHLFACHGMAESDALGVQTEAFGGLAIQAVAHDGRVQTFGMGAVYAQLVSPASHWV